MTRKIPEPAVARLCALYRLLEEFEQAGNNAVSSRILGERLALGAHNIRKDISYLGEIGNTGAGYEVAKLKAHIGAHLGIDIQRKACVVGLGRLGMAIVNYQKFQQSGFPIVAGFDSNINKLETLDAAIRVYPAYMIAEVVQRMNIELAILTVPHEAAQEVANRCVEGGIKGIVNFTRAVIRPARRGVVVRTIDVTGELRILSALIALETAENRSVENSITGKAL
jgi:redox-sensing transcriptional repressor